MHFKGNLNLIKKRLKILYFTYIFIIIIVTFFSLLFQTLKGVFTSCEQGFFQGCLGPLQCYLLVKTYFPLKLAKNGSHFIILISIRSSNNKVLSTTVLNNLFTFKKDNLILVNPYPLLKLVNTSFNKI